MASRKLVIEVVGDASKLDKTFKQAATSTNKFGKALDGLDVGRRGGLSGLSAFAKGGTIALGLGLATQQAVKLTDAASDLNEQISKSEQVFGSSSREVERWSKTTAEGIGISRTAALEASGTFGNLFSTVGIAGDRAAEMSKALVELAADLASFNNADPRDTLDALRSGLIGEAEPLRRFGVLLSEARVQQRAMADTGKDTAKSLTDQEKAIARYEIILGDTGKAQGDFERTSDGLANQQRILRARLADTRAELGSHLLPIMVKATEAANAFFDALEGPSATPSQFLSRDFLNQFRDAFGPDALKDALDKIKPQLDQVIEDFGKSLQPIKLTVDDKVEPPKPPAFGEPGFKVGKAPPVPLGPSVEQRNRFFDDLIGRKEDRVQDIASLEGQVKELTVIEGLIQKRIDATKDVTRKLNLEDQLVQVRRQRRSVVEQIAADSKARVEELKRAREAAREEARRAAELAAEREKTRRQLRQSVALGDVTPGVDNLRKQLQSLTQRLDTSDLKIGSKLQSQLAGARKILSGELGKATVESRQRIQELFATIRGEFDKETKKGPLTKTSGLDTKKILAGLGLSPADERELRSRLSHFNSAGVANARGSSEPGSFVGGRPIVVESHTTVQIDKEKVGKAVTRSQQKKRSRNPSQRRGPNRGLIF